MGLSNSSEKPFQAQGDAVKLIPNAGSNSGDLGSFPGLTVKIHNSSSVVAHYVLSNTASPSVDATGDFVGAGETVYITRERNQQYITAYSAGDASSGVYAIGGAGEQ